MEPQIATAPPVVLLVEDEPLIRMVFADSLADKGVEVVEASNAAAALEIMAERSDVDLIFTDINMPGETDGLDLARAVHRDWPDVRLMLTSGRDPRVPLFLQLANSSRSPMISMQLPIRCSS
jgi:two-component system, response regulator PdtaR